VACPLIRIHPAIVAHAAATCAVMLEGRFFLGVGTGELLNEHVVARRWPAIEIRREMLREAIEIIRQLCSGEVVDFHGRHYEVENARLFTHPAEVPPIVVSAFGPAAIEMAVELGDGVWSTSPDRDLLRQYADAGGSGPRIGQVTLCWSDDRDEAVRIAHRVWPTAGMPGQLSQELPTTTSFEQVAQLVSTDDVAQRIPCGPDVDPVREVIETYARAGFDHLHLHQIGPDQDGFFRFWEKELQPLLEHAR
jgi:G6PDH family F420-dependent oxidoreductase